MKIFFLNGERCGDKVELLPETTVGREDTNDLVIQAGGVSRYHAKFVKDQENWKIIDLGSTNGTRVNHEKVQGERRLDEGDIVEFGNQIIRIGMPKDLTENLSAAMVNKKAPVIHPSANEPPPDNKIVFKPITDINKSSKDTAKPVAAPNADQPLKINLNATEEDNLSELLETINLSKDDNTDIFKKKDTGSNTATTKNSKELSDALKKGKISLFKPSGSKNKAGHQGKSSTPRRKFSNLIFYVTVVCSAVIFITLFIKFQESSHKKPVVAIAPKTITAPFLLTYEKIKLTPDNIFRFAMQVEDKRAFFTIDDLKSQRHYTKEIKEIDQDSFDNLRKEVEDAEFMGQTSPPPGASTNGLDETRVMTVSYNDNINTIKVVNNYPPSSFMQIERLINDFAGNYGLQTIAMTPEELKAKANEFFQKAESLFQNREANPSNLRKAVQRYQLAEELLSQFSPKPPIWQKAKERAKEASEIRERRLQKLNFDLVKYQRLGELAKVDEVLTEMMQLADPEGKLYKNARLVKIKNDQKIRSSNK